MLDKSKIYSLCPKGSGANTFQCLTLTNNLTNKTFANKVLNDIIFLKQISHVLFVNNYLVKEKSRKTRTPPKQGQRE
jgi:hypothetical protein